MKFTTQSGSVYEANTDSKKIRRLNGAADPTPRQGKDGEWRSYHDLICKKGSGAVIVWGTDTELLDDTKIILKEEGGGTALPITTTSTVVSIELANGHPIA